MTFRERPQRVTLETFDLWDQSDETTWPDQQKDNEKESMMRRHDATCDLRLDTDTDYISDNINIYPWIKSDGDSIHNSSNVFSYVTAAIQHENDRWLPWA